MNAGLVYSLHRRVNCNEAVKYITGLIPNCSLFTLPLVVVLVAVSWSQEQKVKRKGEIVIIPRDGNVIELSVV